MQALNFRRTTNPLGDEIKENDLMEYLDHIQALKIREESIRVEYLSEERPLTGTERQEL